MTVRELINTLLDFDMDSDVHLMIELPDVDLEYGDFEVDEHRAWNRRTVVLTAKE